MGTKLNGVAFSLRCHQQAFEESYPKRIRPRSKITRHLAPGSFPVVRREASPVKSQMDHTPPYRVKAKKTGRRDVQPLSRISLGGGKIGISA